MKQPKDIEQLFQEAFKDYYAEPGANAWSNLKGRISKADSAATGSQSASTTASGSATSWLTTALVATAISGAAIGGYFFFNQTAEKQKTKQKQEIVEDKADELLKRNLTLNKAAENLQEEQIEETKSIPLEVKAESKVEAENTNQSEFRKDENLTGSKNLKKVIDIKTEIKSESGSGKNDIADQETKDKYPEVSNFGKVDSQQINSEISDKELQVSYVQNNAQHKTETEISKTPEEVIEQESKVSSEKVNTNQGVFTKEEEKEVAPYVEVPNVFTPNGDGLYDKFIITKSETDEIEVTIYSKTQKVIKKWIGPNGSWDGNMQDGTPAPEGTYFYLITIQKDGKIFKPKRGNVALNR